MLVHWHTDTLALAHLLEDVISRPSMGLAQCFLGNPRYHNVHEAEGEVAIYFDFLFLERTPKC